MSGSVKPPSNGSTILQPAARSVKPTAEGKTARARTVEVVEPDLQHAQLESSREINDLSERDIRLYTPNPQLTPPEVDLDDDGDEFFDAQEDFQLTEADFEVVENIQPPPIPKASYIERFFAILVTWGMDRSKVKNKVSTQTSKLHQFAKDKHRQYKALLKNFGKKDSPERAQSKLELKAIKQEEKSAEEAKTNEAVGYIKLFNALKKIFTGEIKHHQLHLDGLTLGNGKVSLSNVDLTVTQVNLIDNPDGSTTPQITANLNGEVELPLEGQLPLRIKLNMTGVQISLEGRMIPAANVWIGKYGPKRIWQQLQKIRTGKGKLFSLKHVDIKAESIKATLLNPDQNTMAGLITRMKSTRGRAIDKLFVSLGLPLDCNIDELEVKVASSQQPLVSVKGLVSHYSPSELGDSGFEPLLPTETSIQRELSVQADSIDIHTSEVSGALAHTVKQLTPEFMELMPGQVPPEQSWLKQLEGQSAHLDAHVERLDVTLGRQVMKEGGKHVLTGEDHLHVRTGPVTLANKGKATVDFSAQSIAAHGTRWGKQGTFALAADDFSLDANVQQQFPKEKKMKASKDIVVDVKGVVKGDQLSLVGLFNEEVSEVSTNLHSIQVNTADTPSHIEIGSTKIDLPSDISGTMENITLKYQSEAGEKDSEIRATGVTATGQGNIGIQTANHQLNIPVNGTMASKGVEIDWHSRQENEYGQTTSTLNVHPHNFTLNNLHLDHATLKKAEFNVDDSMTGYVELDQVEISGNQLLGSNSPVPAEYQQYIPEAILKDRKLKLSLTLPVKNGRIDPSQANIRELHIDNEQADNEGWIGWGTKKVLDQLQVGAENCSIDGITVSDGRLWISTQINTRLKTFNLWIPLFKVRNYEAAEEKTLLLPELLHGYTDAHFTPLTQNDQELLQEIHLGKPKTLQPKTLQRLHTYCQQAGADKASQLLKRINIQPWIKSAQSGDETSIKWLTSLKLLFLRYPDTSGKALAINLINNWPVTTAELTQLSTPPTSTKLDPVSLAELLSRQNQHDKAYDIVHQAIKKHPDNARLAYFTSVMAERLAKATPVEAMKPDVVSSFEHEIMTPLTRAAQLGHKEALLQLKRRARRGQPLAKLGYAGIILARDKRPANFYQAVSNLENLIAVNDEATAIHALNILQSRARNAGKIFIHAERESDEALSLEKALIDSDEADLLSGDEAYLWGLRHLYGIEGIKADREKALQLLIQAQEKGAHTARIHIDVLKQLKD